MKKLFRKRPVWAVEAASQTELLRGYANANRGTFCQFVCDLLPAPALQPQPLNHGRKFRQWHPAQ